MISNEERIESNENKLYNFIERLYPICRSITGNGVRQTLNFIKEIIPLEITEVPTGTKVFDWTVPKEWNINDAYILNNNGDKIIDFKKSNLHVVNYSIPIDKEITFVELEQHIFTLPDHPDWIPYRTSYYKENWGFCMSQNQFLALKNENYQVVIDSTLESGNLTYGEFYLPGKLKDEVLISTHICHPSMCNDNLSGISVTTYLANYLKNKNLKYSYRFVFVPATIGAITWLAENEENVKNIKFGLVAALLGDEGNFTYKRSRIGNTEIDKIVSYVLKSEVENFQIVDFTPYGYDERQYCSPGFNLPVGRLTRTPNGEFPEYHTSADNLEFVKPDKLGESFELYKKIIEIIEQDQTYVNSSPKGEPQLGKRGLYNSVAGNIKEYELALLWVLNMSDGNNSLMDITEKSNLPFSIIYKASQDLLDVNLLKEI